MNRWGLTPDEALLIPYRLKTVRIGIQATVLAIVALILFALLPRGGPIDPLIYWVVLLVAALGALVVSMLPWPKLLQSRAGLWTMYVWSAADIILISIAIAVSGGGRSELFALYALTTVFFAASYPLSGQMALLVFTYLCYGVALWQMGSDVAPGELVIRMGVLGVVAFIASFLSQQLMRSIVRESELRARAARGAELIEVVARASRQMNSLDYDKVQAEVVECAGALGFDGASLSLFRADKSFRLVHGLGVPDEIKDSVHSSSEGVTGLVLKANQTVVVNDYVDAGFQTAIGIPVWCQGQLDAVLVAGLHESRELDVLEVEAMELLGAISGRALENARLFQEQKRTVERLADLDLMKSDFISNISHELRTPLTVVVGAGLTIERRGDSMEERKRKELIRVMNANAKSLENVIATLLDFSRLESGGMKPEIEDTSLSELLEEVARKTKSLLAAHDFHLQISEPLRVMADPGLMDRVVENLLSNAAKHTPAGSRVVLSSEVDDGQAQVAVTDDGPGIPRGELGHLGERFFRGGHPDRRRTRGVGLGLAVAREILHLHGSDLEVRSEIGEGTTFLFRLPLAESTEALQLLGDSGPTEA